VTALRLTGAGVPPRWQVRLAGAGGLAGAADLQFRLEDHLAVLVRAVPHSLLDEQLRGGAAELLARLADRGQWHRRRGRELDVVVAHDRQIAGHRAVAPGHFLEQSERDQVIGAESGRWTALGWHSFDHRAGLLASRYVRGGGLDDDEVIGGLPGPAQSPDRAVSPVGGLTEGRRAAHVGHPLVPSGQQVRHGEVAAEHVVDGDRAQRPGGRPAVDQDDRGAAALQSGQPLVGARDRRDQDALDPVLFQQLQVTRLPVQLLVAVAQDDGQAGHARLVLDAPGDVGEERVRHVRHDQADGAAAARAQLPGRLIPDEPQRLDRRVHPVPGRPGHDVGPVEHIGDGAHRNAGLRGHILDADRRVHRRPL
jgi:hypothetical protein